MRSGLQIPAELLALDQWVLWRIEIREDKPTKVPYRARAPRRRADSTDPSSWASYEEALAAAERMRGEGGIGFVFTPDDEYAGIDLDHCVDNGRVLAPAWQIVERLDSYAEWSPSGDGVHVIVRAVIVGERKRTQATPWGGDFESYDQGRFFTMTGRHLGGVPTTVQARQAELDAIRAELFPVVVAPGGNGHLPVGGTPSMDDIEVIEKIRASKQGDRFAELFDRGAPEGRESEADLGLCNILAFWFGPGEARIDSVFRRSALMREKWDAKRGDTTYGGYTIGRALEGRTEFYTPPRRGSIIFGDDRAAADAEARAELGDMLGLGDRTVTRVTAGGRDTKARHDIHISDGSALVLDPLGSYTTAAKLGAEIACQLGTIAHLKDGKASRINEFFALIHVIVEVREELTLDQRAVDYGVSFLQEAKVWPVDLNDQAARWAAFCKLRDNDPHEMGHHVLVDDAGRRYVRSGWFHTYVRNQSSPGTADDVGRRMTGLGWLKPSRSGRIKATNPSGPDTLGWAFFVVEAGWEDQ